jgi:peptidyl-prolyl cis-trans isomerase A (cyclophilin A)
MKTPLLKSLIVFAMLLAVPLAAEERARLAELDAFWSEVSRTVREGDFEGYKATCHGEGVLVSGSKKTSQPLSKALERWKQDFADTKAGKIKANVEFRFSQRLGDETTAHETGIFLYSTFGADGQTRKEYIHFEALLLKRGGWKTLMEYQKSKATREEWEALNQRSEKPVLVVFETELGNITMEVDLVHAPNSGANFLKYIDGKFYDGGMINRAVRPDNTIRHDVEVQVIQFQSDPARENQMFPPIPMERTSVTGLKHLSGVLSMARDGPDTAQASFSIVIGAQPEMDFGGKRNPDGQGFAVFGRVVAGMEVVKKIHQAHTGASGPYKTETLEPPIKILKAYRKKSLSLR